MIFSILTENICTRGGMILNEFHKVKGGNPSSASGFSSSPFFIHMLIRNNTFSLQETWHILLVSNIFKLSTTSWTPEQRLHLWVKLESTIFQKALIPSFSLSINILCLL